MLFTITFTILFLTCRILYYLYLYDLVREQKMIAGSLYHKYRARPTYKSMQSDQALYTIYWPSSSSHLDIP